MNKVLITADNIHASREILLSMNNVVTDPESIVLLHRRADAPTSSGVSGWPGRPGLRGVRPGCSHLCSPSPV